MPSSPRSQSVFACRGARYGTKFDGYLLKIFLGRLSPSDLDKAGGGLLTGYNCLAETRYRSLVTDPRPRPPDRGDAYVSEMADFRTVIMKR